MRLTADQCAVIAQVIPTLVIALMAERYFGSEVSDDNQAFSAILLALFVGVPSAEVVCLIGVNGGIHGRIVGPLGCVWVWAVLGLLLFLIAFGVIWAADTADTAADDDPDADEHADPPDAGEYADHD